MYLAVVLTIIAGTYILNLCVERLNLSYLSDRLPVEFEGYYDAEKYKTSQQYLKDTTRFELAVDGFFMLLTVVFIVTGGFNLVDRIARSWGCGEIATGLLFAGMLMAASEILHIPFSLYDTFVIEERFGFNRTTAATFIADMLKGWFLTALIGAPVFGVIIWFFQKTGEAGWLYCWGVVTLVQLVLTFIAPVVIMPLFNKFVPLDPGDLKAAIEAYARSQCFKMQGIFTMDGSKRSTKTNAFFTGLGRFRRIVLFDTLIRQHTIDELVAILAHEIGHYKKKHILQSLLVSVIATGIMFYILSLFLNNRELFEAFRMEKTSVYASLFFFGFLYAPLAMLIGVFSNMLSRKNEYAADRFAIATCGKPQAMIDALKKLSVANLSNLTPHPLKVFLSYSHPPVLERIRRIRGYDHAG